MGKNKVVVAGSSVSAGQMKDFWRQIGDGSITEKMMQDLLEHRNPFMATDDPITDWTNFYAFRGMHVDLSNVVIPKKKKGLDRIIIVAANLNHNMVYNWCKDAFKADSCHCYTQDLDEDINIRISNRHYAIWTRDKVEPDKELQSTSAKDLDGKNYRTMNLIERLLFGLKYHNETGKQLDQYNFTLCSGSSTIKGYIPDTHWEDGNFWVGVSQSDERACNLRSRSITL